jgi:hypothetical protein
VNVGILTLKTVHAVAQLVEVLRRKLEGLEFDSRWCHSHNPSGHTMVLGSTQPLTEMSIRNISYGVKAALSYGLQSYRPNVSTVLKSGSLKLLETAGPDQACTGTASPLPCL